MERRTFIQALLVATVLFFGLNMVVGRLGKDAVPRVIDRKARASATYTDVFLGNSLVQDGFSEKTWKSVAGGSPMNAGLGWSTAAEHAVLWDEVLKGGSRPKRVYYGFFDLQLHEYTNSVWWALGGNMAMSYFVDPKLSAKYHAPGSILGSSFMRAAKHAPVFTERFTFWGKVEKLRRTISDIGMRPKAAAKMSAEPAPSDAFAAFAASSTESFVASCVRTVRDNAPFHPAIDDIIDSAKRAGAEVYFVEMPMPPDHRHRFYDPPAWTAYKHWLKERLAARGAKLIEAGDWVPDGGMFKDSMHLDKAGSVRFTERLAAETADPARH